MYYDIPNSSNDGVCVLREPGGVTCRGDDFIIDRAIAYRKAGGRFYTFDEFKAHMREAIVGARSGT